MSDSEKDRFQQFQNGDVSWYENEFLGLYLGDERLKTRLGLIMDARMNNPNGSIPLSMKTWAKTKGAYRFFANDKVKPKLILDSHLNATIKRLGRKTTILAVQDTSDISYINHPMTTGLGYINNSELTKGMHYHPTIAVTTDGTPLGILESKVWVRKELKEKKDKKKRMSELEKLPIEEKESFKWIESYRKLCEIEESNPDSFHFISVCDREADIYELFHEHFKRTNENKPDLLIRARSDRNIINGETEHLFDELKELTEFAEYDIIIPKKKNSQARETTLRVKFKPVTIKPSLGLLNRSSYSNIPLYAVSTTEVNPPKNTEPVHWFILTTMPILDYTNAFEVIEWYRQRWVIEIFFKTLKSACNIEDYQFKSFERLEKVLAIEAIIAWRILYLTTLGREYPDIPASVLFEEHEWQALHARIHMTKDVPKEVPKLSVVMKQIGSLGGHLGRKSDGHPGVITLAKGLHTLYSISIIWKLFNSG